MRFGPYCPGQEKRSNSIFDMTVRNPLDALIKSHKKTSSVVGIIDSKDVRNNIPIHFHFATPLKNRKIKLTNMATEPEKPERKPRLPLRPGQKKPT